MNNLILLILFSLLFQNNKDTIPLLDLRNNNGVIFDNLNFNSSIPDSRKEGSIKLSFDQMESIKNKSKTFEPLEVTSNDIIVINTNQGEMKFKFYSEIAPNHCYNFKKLANSKFYDETLFHRVIKNFIIQGGDILSRDDNPENDGTGGPGWTIDAEFSNMKHVKGTLSMSRSSTDINSAGSQFFISLNNNNNLDNNYTIFAYIIEGEYILDIISRTSSEYDQAMMLVKQNIPINEDEIHWVEILDSRNNKVFFAKVPEFINKVAYKKEIERKMKNLYVPGSPIVIKSIRVINE